MSSIPRPSRSLQSQVVSTISVPAEKLLRVTRHADGEPYFARTGANRFDDRSRVKSKRYGTCYFGLSLEVAMAETILHDEMPVKGKFSIAAQEIESRYLVRFKGGRVTLIDLTGVSLKSLIGSSAISTVMPYDLSQLWSMALHRHRAQADGLLYMSRHVNSDKAVVLFDRAQGKLKATGYTPLPKAAAVLDTLLKLKISVKYA